MPSSYNDGNVNFGSQLFTIGTETYEGENITFEENTNIIVRRDHLNVRNGQVVQLDGSTGSATLQLATALTTIPAVCDTFTASWRGATVTCIITKVSEPQAQDQIHKINVDFVVRINTP